ncbi:hypothetical protein HC928_02610 [bacterium]|nr:hypothetical protein [bacterium]
MTDNDNDWTAIEDNEPVAEPAEIPDSLLTTYGEIFAQCLQSQRFKQVFEAFFTLTKVVDESTKTVTFSLIENPPEVIAKVMSQQAKKEEPTILPAQPADLKKVAQRAKRK